MKILGIDTSCDDTAVAVLKIEKEGARRRRKGGRSNVVKLKILSNIISSQVKLHAKYGGVYPFLAKREHIKNLPLVFRRATKGIKLSEIDLIGVTNGPGLEPCLWQGINFAKKLTQDLKLPIIPVNHIEAHILANFINLKSESLNLKSIFPAVCLVVSGGHTQLILMKDIRKYKLIGETRDDAAGECFDKTARILGLGYPGGPAIAEQARRWKSEIRNPKFEIKLPRPMIYQKNYDFSFSGLKTAVLYKVKSEKRKAKSEKYIQAMCAEIQQSIIDVLIHKTVKVAKDFKTKSIILGGGVAANEELRKQFKEKIEKEIPNTKYLIPDTKYCTDNAVMIAATAYFHRKEAVRNWQKIKADANLRI